MHHMIHIPYENPGDFPVTIVLFLIKAPLCGGHKRVSSDL